MRRYLIAGNWKMNTNLESGTALASAVAEQAGSATDKVDILLCPPSPYLISIVQAVGGSKVVVGAQNAHFEESGAYTGEISLDMVQDTGCTAVILGHSERRHVFGETDELINKKVEATVKKGLQAVLCVGELIEEREANKTEEVLDTQMAGGLDGITAEQMANVVIAYEPVWAIGTGHTASKEQAEEAHLHLRQWLATRFNDEVAQATRILYGGSVKPANAGELLSQPNVDGALVGGASLTPENFVPIIEAGVAAAG